MTFCNGYWAVIDDTRAPITYPTYPDYICHGKVWMIDTDGMIVEGKIDYDPTIYWRRISDDEAKELFIMHGPQDVIDTYKKIQKEKDSLWNGLDI